MTDRIDVGGYLRHIVDELGGGYVEQVDDEYYFVRVERMTEREQDGTLIPADGDGE
jgi:hypothetical protein